MTAHSNLALAARLGALSPTAAVQSRPERMRQWVDRLLLAGFAADAGRDPAEAVAEADLYSGRPRPPLPWPAPVPLQSAGKPDTLPAMMAPRVGVRP